MGGVLMPSKFLDDGMEIIQYKNIKVVVLFMLIAGIFLITQAIFDVFTSNFGIWQFLFQSAIGICIINLSLYTRKRANNEIEEIAVYERGLGLKNLNW